MLCVGIDRRHFKCVHLSIDKLPHEMVEHFNVFGSQYKNQLFEVIWEKKINEFCAKLDNAAVNFDAIYTQVWKPTISSCKELLHKLYNEMFIFSDIKDFAHISNIISHVANLYNAMATCYSSSVSLLPEPIHWVSQAEENVKLYLQFTKNIDQLDFASDNNHLNVAKLCLNLKELLKLKGDFSVVYNLNSLVRKLIFTLFVCMYIH